jgi:hypothetical protein
MDRTVLLAFGFLLAFTPSLPSGAETASASPALGRLSAEGHASLETNRGALELADGMHPYFAGDRIVAGDDGGVLLTLHGGAVTLEPGAAVRVRLAPDGHRIALERGTARIQFQPASDFELSLGGLRVRPRHSDGPDARPPGEIDLLASFDPQLGTVIGSRAGVLQTLAADGSPDQTIGAGETRGFALHPPGALPEVSAASEDEGLGERVRLIALRVGGAAGLMGLGYGVHELVDDDDDDNNDPASPTN